MGKNKKVAIGAALLAVASAVTFGLVKKNKDKKAKETKKVEEE